MRSNNKRIAKNALYLYLRMLMVMVVSLFTVRVVLNALGAVDYGINNVVGGFVAMFVFLTSALNSASLRFFSYNIGRNDQEKLSIYFSMSFWCYVLASVLVFAVAETVGLWFVMNKLTIPTERMDAALWVYQFSVCTFIINLLAVPYNTMIIAHERMNTYAWLGILECLLKLAVAYIIYICTADKLKVYTSLTFCMMMLVNAYYVVYCLRNFRECHLLKLWKPSVFREIAGFSGWTLFGALSGVVREQGINILLNVFFNPIVNAARAIAFQVNACVNQFVLNFYKAVQPQITKNYGAGELQEMHTLVLRSSRMCFYLILLLSTPILLETEFLLTLWLKNVPENAILFTRLVVITAIIDSTSYPLQTSIQATGHIKYFQTITGGLTLMNLPVAWVLLKMGYPPESTMYTAIAISCLAQMTRIGFTNRYTGLGISDYITDVLVKILLVTAITYILPALAVYRIEDGWGRFILVSAISILSCCVAVWTLGLKKDERINLQTMIKQKIHVG